MSGLKFDDRAPKLINARTHAVIDYVHVATNFMVAAIFRNRNRRASNAAFALGASVLFNALMTDYQLGVFRAYSFKVHGILDYGVAASSAIMPAVLGFHDTPEAAFFYAQGAGETAIAAVSDYDDIAGSRRGELIGRRNRIAA
jgi:hypothetical protein